MPLSSGFVLFDWLVRQINMLLFAVSLPLPRQIPLFSHCPRPLHKLSPVPHCCWPLHPASSVLYCSRSLYLPPLFPIAPDLFTGSVYIQVTRLGVTSVTSVWGRVSTVVTVLTSRDDASALVDFRVHSEGNWWRLGRPGCVTRTRADLPGTWNKASLSLGQWLINVAAASQKYSWRDFQVDGAFCVYNIFMPEL